MCWGVVLEMAMDKELSCHGADGPVEKSGNRYQSGNKYRCKYRSTTNVAMKKKLKGCNKIHEQRA